MKISFVTDEISADLETAVELGTEWGIQDFELRTYDTQRVPLFTDYQKQRVRELIDEYELTICAISPGLFKCPYPASERDGFSLQAFDASFYQQWHDAQSLLDYHLNELLPASIAYARELGVGHIISFGFHRAGQPEGMPPDGVLRALERAAEQVAEAAMQLSIEVEADFWADTGRHTTDILDAINHPALGINWDPGNAYVAGDTPYPAGYEAAKKYIRHMHFKDVARDPSGETRYVVNGDIDWTGQIKALMQDGYSDYISVETHMRPRVSSAKAALNRLKNLLAVS